MVYTLPVVIKISHIIPKLKRRIKYGLYEGRVLEAFSQKGLNETYTTFDGERKGTSGDITF